MDAEPRRFIRTRKHNMKPTAILTADWHIRPTKPQCRTDDFLAAMKRKVEFIMHLQNKYKYGCPVLIAGDIGHHPLENGWPLWLERWTIDTLRSHEIIAIPGQHDLPNHRLDMLNRSGLDVLRAATVVRVLDKDEYIVVGNMEISPFPYGVEISPPKGPGLSKYQIAMAHQMVIESKPLFPGQVAPKGASLLDKYPQYDLILTGDNHMSFVAEKAGRFLVNPGSLTRMTAAQINHRPCVYLWYANECRIEQVFLPIENDVISREHIEVAEQRDKRMDIFMRRVNETTEIELLYEDNLIKYFGANRTESAVKNRVWEAVGTTSGGNVNGNDGSIESDQSQDRKGKKRTSRVTR